MLEQQLNWAGNHIYRAARWHRPETREQVQALVRQCRRLKALGTRHSFNDIADTPEDLCSLENFSQFIRLDRERHTVTVGAGMRYGPLCQYLHREGYALHNLASLPHISVAGACATATHGSGDWNGNLATAVAALEMITADGEGVVLSREHDEEFQGAVVGLGGLGIVTQVTLDVLPAFEMRQAVYENLPLEQLEAHFDEITANAYSVSLFTDWRRASFNQIWFKWRSTDDARSKHSPTASARTRTSSMDAPSELAPELFGARLAPGPRHPIADLSPVNCTEQLGLPGPWHERLPHFRLDYTPSSGEELQTEYFVPRQHALEGLRAVYQLREHIAPLLQISEVRTIAADDLWLSPCYQQACVSIHFTWQKNWPAVQQVLPLLEEQLAPLQARPHWGKLFTLSPARVPALYPKLPDFRRLLQAYDPQGKFRNAFLDTYIFGGVPARP
jgi:alditol oxidase